MLSEEKCYWCYYPTNRNFFNLVRNTIMAVKILIKERPDVIISSGAGAAIAYFYLGKLFKCKTIFIEVYDRIDNPTLTGKIVHPVTDKFIVQWEEQEENYPNSINLGGIV